MLAIGLLGPLIGSLALSGFGAFRQGRKQKKADRKQRRLAQAESTRQRKLGDEARRTVAETLAQFTPEEQTRKQEAIVGKNLEKVSQLIGEKAPASFQSGSAPQLVTAFQEAKEQEGRGEGLDFAENLARFGASGLALDAAGRVSSAGAQTIDRLNQDRRISASLLDPELAAAAQTGFSPLGAISSQIGQAGLATTLGGGFGTFRKRRPTGILDPDDPEALDESLLQLIR